MSEGYQCDRCGSAHGGGPDTMLVVGEGRSRDRPPVVGGPSDSPHYEVNGPTLRDVELDLCRSCRNDLRQWHAAGGGDPSHIERDGGDGE